MKSTRGAQGHGGWPAKLTLAEMKNDKCIALARAMGRPGWAGWAAHVPQKL